MHVQGYKYEQLAELALCHALLLILNLKYPNRTVNYFIV